jgi:hypothetical protein
MKKTSKSGKAPDEVEHLVFQAIGVDMRDGVGKPSRPGVSDFSSISFRGLMDELGTRERYRPREGETRDSFLADRLRKQRAGPTLLLAIHFQENDRNQGFERL